MLLGVCLVLITVAAAEDDIPLVLVFKLEN
jgi:hypothetical protein